MGRATTRVGEIAGEVGEALESVPGRVREVAGAAVARATGDVAMKDTTAAAIKSSQNLLLKPFEWTGDVVELTGKGIKATGDVTAAVGRQMQKGPGQAGFLGGIAAQGEAPTWLRATASAARRADPALRLGANFGRGAGAGGAFGFGIGVAADDPDLAWTGLGTGLAIGATVTPLGMLAAPDLKLRQQNDVATWLRRYEVEEATLRRSGLNDEADAARDVYHVLRSRDLDTQVRAAELEDLVRGVSTMYGMGEIPIKWFYDENAIGRGEYDTEAGVIRVNLYESDITSTLAHEVMHALEQVPHEGMQAAVAKLNGALFGMPGPGRERLGGMYTAREQVEFANQYMRKLRERIDDTSAKLEKNPSNIKLREILDKQERSWDNWMRNRGLDPDISRIDAETFFSNEALQDSVFSEIRAELFSSQYRGAEAGSTYKSNTYRQQWIDKILLETASSKLGRLRIFLES